MKSALTAWLAFVLLLVGVSLGWALTSDQATLTVQVTSADHEVAEGYFSLGEEATVMVKPGSELYRFLSRHRGKKVKIVLTESAERELSRIDR